MVIQLNCVDDEMKNCVSSLEQHYKAFCLVLKIDCALYWLKSGILKIKLRVIQEGFTEVLIVDLGPRNWAQSGLPMMAEPF